MSIAYSIVVKLDLLFSENNIRKILEKGFDLGFNYYKFESGMTDVSAPIIDVYGVQAAIERTFNEDEIRCIIVKYQTTYFYLHFLKKDSYLIVMFCGLSDTWSKVYAGNKKDINIHQYASLMLDLVNTFKILSMKINLD